MSKIYYNLKKKELYAYTSLVCNMRLYNSNLISEINATTIELEKKDIPIDRMEWHLKKCKYLEDCVRRFEEECEVFNERVDRVFTKHNLSKKEYEALYRAYHDIDIHFTDLIDKVWNEFSDVFYLLFDK